MVGVPARADASMLGVERPGAEHALTASGTSNTSGLDRFNCAIPL
jgi:hypothetical protein